MERTHKTPAICQPCTHQLLLTLKLSSPSLSRPFTESMSATKSTFIAALCRASHVSQLMVFCHAFLTQGKFWQVPDMILCQRNGPNVSSFGRYFVLDIQCGSETRFAFVAASSDRSPTLVGATCLCGFGLGLQNIAANLHHNILQNIEKYCRILENLARYCKILQDISKHCHKIY